MDDKLAVVIAAELPLVHLLVGDGHYQEASGLFADAIRNTSGAMR